MWSLIKGIISPITDLASELIDTPLELAQAQVLKIKALDPNGKMRRQLSKSVTLMYMVYIFSMLGLIAAQFFGYGIIRPEDGIALAKWMLIANDAQDLRMITATDSLKELFLPITGAFTAIVSASFGVNYANVKKDIK